MGRRLGGSGVRTGKKSKGCCAARLWPTSQARGSMKHGEWTDSKEDQVGFDALRSAAARVSYLRAARQRSLRGKCEHVRRGLPTALLRNTRSAVIQCRATGRRATNWPAIYRVARATLYVRADMRVWPPRAQCSAPNVHLRVGSSNHPTLCSFNGGEVARLGRQHREASGCRPPPLRERKKYTQAPADLWEYQQPFAALPGQQQQEEEGPPSRQPLQPSPPAGREAGAEGAAAAVVAVGFKLAPHIQPHLQHP